MKKFLSIFITTAFIVSYVALTYATTNSSNSAQQIYCSTENIINGNIGILVGLAIALFGFYQFLVAQNTKGGLIMIFVGALVTMLPSVYISFLNGLKGAFSSTVGNTTKINAPGCSGVVAGSTSSGSSGSSAAGGTAIGGGVASGANGGSMTGEETDENARQDKVYYDMYGIPHTTIEARDAANAKIIERSR